MLIAVITLSVALAAAIGAIVYMVVKLSGITPGLVLYGKQLVEAVKAQAAAEIQRDEAIVKQNAAEFETAEANRQLTKMHEEFVTVLKENADAVVKQIRTAPDLSTALDIFNGVLPKVPDVRADTSPEAPSASDTDLEDPRGL